MKLFWILAAFKLTKWELINSHDSTIFILIVLFTAISAPDGFLGDRAGSKISNDSFIGPVMTLSSMDIRGKIKDVFKIVRVGSKNAKFVHFQSESPTVNHSKNHYWSSKQLE